MKGISIMSTNAPLQVLIIDDDGPTQDIVRTILEHNDCTINIAATGQEGLSYLENSQNLPDVVIVDIFLPVLDGYQVLNEIKRRGLSNSTTFVATTAYYTLDTPTEVANHGFHGYLPKPLNSTQLVPYLEKTNAARRNSG
jgi:CheY-like chemotaxis protein